MVAYEIKINWLYDVLDCLIWLLSLAQNVYDWSKDLTPYNEIDLKEHNMVCGL